MQEARVSSTLTLELIEQFTRLIKKGLPADGVCDYLGISGSAYYNWLRKGEKFIEGNGEPKEWAMYGAFVTAFRKATAVYRMRRLASLHEKSNGLWVRDLAILERRDRRNFSRYEQAGGGDDSLQPDESFL
jgi:hypothetical protein